MKTIEHQKGYFGVCQHSGREWFAALAKTLECTKTSASIAEMESIVQSLNKGEAVWHRGILFTAR